MKPDGKVVLLGDMNVGKTSLLHRYMERRFQDTISTVEGAFYLKQWGPHNISVWDTAELPPSIATSTACLSSQQGKVPLRLPSYSNSCGVAPQASVKRQQPQASKKQRISSTSSVCTTSSKKSCKSTASQIQEVAGDDSCTLCALACLFCEFMTICSLFLECGACRGCLEACCSRDGGEPLSGSCCGEAGGGNCPYGLGCGMLQDCCGSSDCLEICLECCSICFPA